MDYDDAIRDAAVALWHNEAARAAPNVAKTRNAETWRDVDPREQEKWLQQARAAAPILMEYGARLMREAAAKALIGYIHPDPDGLPGRLFASAQVRDLDPATIVREAVK